MLALADSTIVYVVLAALVVLFLVDRLPAEMVAIGSAVVLWATGVLGPAEALAGFWHPTVVFVASLLIVATALESTGITAWAGHHLVTHADGDARRLTVWTMVLAAALTSLITVHGAVAALIPLAVASAARVRMPASQLLLPLAVAAHAGTQLTLAGSQVNILFSEASRDAGAGYFEFFEYALVGIPLVLGTIAIVVLGTRRLLPDRGVAEPAADAQVASEVTSEVTSEVMAVHLPSPGWWRAVMITGAMVVLLATGVVAPAAAGLMAVVALLLARVLTPEAAIGGINWTTILLIAGMIPMSTAMSSSGAADDIAHAITEVVGDGSPYLLLAVLFAVVAVLGQLMSNTATALVVIPVAVAAAHDLDVSVRPVLMSLNVVTVAALLTPVATAANTMIAGPGGYRFGDYAKFGWPLLLWWFVIAVGYVPLIWSF